MLNALLYSIDERLSGIPNFVIRDDAYVEDVLKVVKDLCSKIKPTKNNDTLDLGFDTNELMTDYIRHYYESTKQREKYMIIAKEFKTAIEAVFSTTCTVGDLKADGETGLFEFIFSREDNSPISVHSREYAKGGILVYLVVHKPKEIDPMDGW